MSFIRFKGISGQSLFWKCYCLFFSGAQNQCAISPFQNCYIKMSWHMCLKCKIYKKEKIHLMLTVFYFHPFFMVQKLVLFLLFMTKFICHLFIDVYGERLAFYLSGRGDLNDPLAGNLVSQFRKMIFLSLPPVRDRLILCFDIMLNHFLFSYPDTCDHLNTGI